MARVNEMSGISSPSENGLILMVVGEEVVAPSEVFSGNSKALIGSNIADANVSRINLYKLTHDASVGGLRSKINSFQYRPLNSRGQTPIDVEV
jgi:hypothetical protein